MNDGMFCYVTLTFPKNNMADWEKAETEWDEYEWEEEMGYMISDLGPSRVSELIQEMEKLTAKNKKNFFSVETSKDKREITLKGYMDFDNAGIYLVGWLNLFRKAREFGAQGKAAFMSDVDFTEGVIMYAFEIKPKGDFYTYLVPDNYADPDDPKLKKFNTIWNDDIAVDIKKIMK